MAIVLQTWNDCHVSSLLEHAICNWEIAFAMGLQHFFKNFGLMCFKIWESSKGTFGNIIRITVILQTWNVCHVSSLIEHAIWNWDIAFAMGLQHFLENFGLMRFKMWESSKVTFGNIIWIAIVLQTWNVCHVFSLIEHGFCNGKNPFAIGLQFICKNFGLMRFKIWESSKAIFGNIF
jgi:hypothetical protein